MKFNRTNITFLLIILILLFITIAKGFYTIYFEKNFEYLVEAPCDQTTQTCYIRDCSNPDDCPLNGLTEYTKYSITAKYFKLCSDNSCQNICGQQNDTCKEVICGGDSSDTCTSGIEQ